MKNFTELHEKIICLFIILIGFIIVVGTIFAIFKWLLHSELAACLMTIIVCLIILDQMLG